MVDNKWQLVPANGIGEVQGKLRLNFSRFEEGQEQPIPGIELDERTWYTDHLDLGGLFKYAIAVQAADKPGNRPNFNYLEFVSTDQNCQYKSALRDGEDNVGKIRYLAATHQLGPCWFSPFNPKGIQPNRIADYRILSDQLDCYFDSIPASTFSRRADRIRKVVKRGVMALFLGVAAWQIGQAACSKTPEGGGGKAQSATEYDQNPKEIVYPPAPYEPVVGHSLDS